MLPSMLCLHILKLGTFASRLDEMYRIDSLSLPEAIGEERLDLEVVCNY